MLTVEAIQHGDPITGVIALEPNDPTLHDPSVRSARYQRG
jgi:hypothetical protein